MKIGVCVKVTPDTDTRIKIAGAGIDTSGIKWILSPYDAFALEKAVQIKEKSGGEVVMITIGDKSVQKNILDGLAVGADSAIHIDDAALNGADSLGIARALAAAAKSEGIELLFCGKKAIDGDSQQVPAMVAELLGWPQVTQATEIEVAGVAFTATRAIGSGLEQVVTGSAPAVITAEVGLATPRYAKLPDIMKAKKKPLTVKSLADIGLSAADVAPVVSVSGWSLPPERAKGKVLQGDREQVAKELVRLLREEAKVL